MVQIEGNDFLVVSRPVTNAKIRLVCFPHSGGGPSAFAAWADILEESFVEVVVISAPGRERRVELPSITDMDSMVSNICTALQTSGLVDGLPYAFFGHSLGALVAYETARKLDADMVAGRPRPLHLFASGHGGPETMGWSRGVEHWGSLHTLPDDQLTEAVRSFGAMPTTAASEDAGLLRALLPALRADFQLYETYSPAPHRTPLPLPLTALGGDQDLAVPTEHLESWQQETSQWTGSAKVFEGGHFYLVDHLKEVLAFVRAVLEASLARLPKSLMQSQVAVPAVCHKQLIAEVLEQWAETQPTADALVDPHERVTFGELVERARLLGQELFGSRFLDGRTGQVVALLMPHNCDYVISMLGIWYASGMIIVVEAHFPEAMCREVCEEARTAAAVASPAHAAKFANVSGCRTLELGQDWVGRLERLHETSVVLRRPALEDTCILMFTSGTTGRPKTIAGSHFFMHAGALAKNFFAPFDTADDFREAYNVMFVWEVMRAPLLGYTGYLLPDEATLDPHVFANFMQKHQCSRALTTPSLLVTLMDSLSQNFATKLSSMRTWMMCGEVLPMKVANRFRETLPRCKLINDYSTWESGDIGYALVAPAGRYEPSQVFAVGCQDLACGVSACIIDPETKQTMPRGLVGELYVGGPVLSFGYHGQIDATAAKFSEGANGDMVALSQGKWRWYKTGDAARFVGDPPVLEIRGRIDSTVKIRGFKVGIPVVEAAIAQVPGVALCAVVPVYETPTAVDSLLCFVKAEEGLVYDDLVQKIKREAVKELPRWMMPSYFRPLPADCFMGGESRKLNRRRLAELADLKTLKEAQQGPPQLELQQPPPMLEEAGVTGVVRAVWAKVLSLSLDMVDPEENFFDLGGHSALAARMATELSGEYNLPITVLDIYSHSTLQALCDFAESKAQLEGGGLQVLSPKNHRVNPLEHREAPRMAVAGFSGKFPGADSVQDLWENIQRAAVSATFLSKDFLRRKGVPETTLGHKDFVPAAYMINDADKFDNVFFGIGRHEASLMDPQHRVFIQESWAALENAALPPKQSLQDAVVGVFAAAGIDGYMVHHLDGKSLKDTMNPQDIFLTEIGNEKDYIATRVSYLLDFTGPSMNVNSACSSALVAVAQAAAAVAANQCDAAVAGASSITFPNLGYLYSDGLVSSKDGYVRPFDAGADGTVFGDSVAAMVLRRQEDVGESGLLYAGLRGFAVSNDGAQKAGYAAPSSNGQARAIQVAMNMLGEDPWSISYVECHCTGTRIGDGIEIHGLLSAFENVGGRKQAGSDTTVALGSVKGNIAHANCAAGATGLIKALAMMGARSLAPTANFKQLNPKINLENTPFFVNSEVCQWNKKKPLRAGVSSFGIGGTNAHTILEEVNNPTVDIYSTAKKPLGFQLLTLSAKTPGSLRKAADRLSSSLKAEAAQSAPAAVQDFAYTLQAGRASLALRRTAVVPADGTRAEALKRAAEVLVSSFPDVEELEELDDARKRPPVAFVFPGQGSQYLGMARGLYEQVALFQRIADQCCEQLASPQLLGQDLRPLLFGNAFTAEEAQKEFEKPSVLQPALFVVEYALSQVFLAVNVKPVACAGHSLGEYSAAVVGGFLSLDAALAIVAARARSTETLAEEGAMLSVADWSSEELEAVATGSRPGLWLAAVNSPQHAVVSGEVQAIAALEAELKADGRKCSRLHVKRAFHSGLIAKAADMLRNLGMTEEMQGVETLPVASNLTGQWLHQAHMKDGQYWTKHMRGTVLWRENAERLMSQWRPAIVLEVGPGNVLSTLTSKCVQPHGHKPDFVQAMRHPKASGTHDVEALLGALGKLWEAGCPVNFDQLHTKVLGATRVPPSARLPAYAFETTPLWVNPERSVYVDATEDPAPAAYVAAEASAPSGSSSRVLVRYGEDRETEPALKAYCLPFASGSSAVFAPWTEDETVEVIAVELPGRGKRSEEAMPADDAGDDAMLQALMQDIMADLRGCPYVLVGFSMGGGLAMELAMRIAAAPNCPEPLAVYVAGRKPPAQNPSLVSDINMSNEELAAYAFAPPEAAASAEFREHVVPLLRADLEADARAEKRLSNAGLEGRQLPATVGVELFCGTSDTVAPWLEAPGWQRYAGSAVGLHYLPGGHEFMQEQRTNIFAAWRRDALGRLVQRRSAEAALLAAQSFAPAGKAMLPGLGASALLTGGSSSSRSGSKTKVEDAPLPLYAVRWHHATPAENPAQGEAAPVVLKLGSEAIAEGDFQRALEAAKKGTQIVAVALPTPGAFCSQEEEVQLSWHFVQLVQRLLEAGVGARLLVVCPAAATGAMAAGASKAAAMEDSSLKIQRIFVPVDCLQRIDDLVPRLCAVSSAHKDETDLWIRDASLRGLPFVPRLERMPAGSAKALRLHAKGFDGEPAKLLLTGATGGLGKAVVSWLIKEQGFQPEQLLLLRRAGSSKLEGELARCTVVEAAKVDCQEMLKESLKEVQGISGILHLAGVLDDGVVGGMTEERMRKVAQPKCGMLTALLNAAKELQWPLQWTLGFSSTSSLFGYAGQVNYCAANALLDQLAAFSSETARPEGDRPPCRFITVNWGPWGEAGMAQVGTKAYEQAVKEGDTPLSTAAALRCLAVALRQVNQAEPSTTQLCACDVEWQKSQWQDLPILDHVYERQAAPAAEAQTEDKGSKESSVQGFLAQQAKAGGSWGRVKGKSLHQLGLDSLELVQLRNLFNKKYNVNVPLGIIADPSQKLGELASALLKFVA